MKAVLNHSIQVPDFVRGRTFDVSIDMVMVSLVFSLMKSRAHRIINEGIISFDYMPYDSPGRGHVMFSH